MSLLSWPCLLMTRFRPHFLAFSCLLLASRVHSLPYLPTECRDFCSWQRLRPISFTITRWLGDSGVWGLRFRQTFLPISCMQLRFSAGRVVARSCGLLGKLTKDSEGSTRALEPIEDGNNPLWNTLDREQKGIAMRAKRGEKKRRHWRYGIECIEMVLREKGDGYYSEGR